MDLLPGSPAINAGTSGTGIPTTDQRGMSRVGATDIGAVESQGLCVQQWPPARSRSRLLRARSSRNPLGAKLTEKTSNAVLPGATITFTGPASGAGITPGTQAATTGSSGVASLMVTANAILGAYTVHATATGLTAVSFSLTNLTTPHTLAATTLSDGSLATNLRGALLALNDDPGAATDTIKLNAGTYALTSGELDITCTAHTLIIQGQGTTGAGATIINASAFSRVFHIVNPGTTVEFQNLVITGGRAAGSGMVAGGGIYNNGGNLTLNNVAILSNSAVSNSSNAQGGGVFSNSGSVSLVGCTVSGNTAGGTG